MLLGNYIKDIKDNYKNFFFNYFENKNSQMISKIIVGSISNIFVIILLLFLIIIIMVKYSQMYFKKSFISSKQ